MSTDTFDRLSEWPLATRDECWRAFRPAQPFSASAFQRLRREALMSPGIRLQRRHRGQLLGQERCFSRLNLLALNAYRLGDEDEARRLARAATALEDSDEVQDLVKMLDTEKPTDRPLDQGSEQWSLLLTRVCQITDSLSDDARRPQIRFPALVRDLRDGIADLLLKQGDLIAFSEVKLSNVVRPTPGAAVFLYLIDLGGADELIRARPGVDVGTDETASRGMESHQGVFDRMVTNAEGHEADMLDELFSDPPRPREIDLTGLRVVR